MVRLPLASRPILAALALALVLASSGCLFQKVRSDQRTLEGFVQVPVSVEAIGWAGLPLIVASGRLPEAETEGQLMVISNIHVLDEPRELSMWLEPGSYVVGAFEDANNNGAHDKGERGVLSEPFEIAAGDVPAEIVLRVSTTFDRGLLDRHESVVVQSYVAGDVVPLDDDRFSPKWGQMGLWEPAKYLLERKPGIYMLGPYDPERTPVLLVHGMSGFPQEFEAIIAAMDTTRFQPWVFMYPSGFALADLAQFLREMVVALEVKYDYPRMCVVAHSMGGLVSRGFLARYTETNRNHRIYGYATLASPLDGMPSAALGVKMAPAVILAWYDLVPGSPYLEQIYARPLDDQIEYHQLFTFDDSGSSDGVVPITSQLRDEAQAEAEVLRGFRATHTGVLESASAIAQVNAMLDRCRGDREGAPSIAPREIGDASGGVAPK